ncbi:ferredoxin--NADP reductase [Pseudovibrio sp. Tun.PSC04-5.I4]|uniref:ferredoxin--NADP reductase n=1 Tax=Pseudovibrio sp. Tun.PSC04-5.I4 TaxID=1798213 RepID=UPI00087F5EAB|nr:ferredoxin--NADP reductase [Pseudovibrio sp. Tun.PSC04-5.I4]SDQ87959.1 ring-1,2-phenylacetyl-CoA epoxidase subunit PaaE [Pseudovibrio sp. Tun.PSC04-5.I4]
MRNIVYPLRVSEVTAETKQVKTLRFDMPEELRREFIWKPGQHITIELVKNGERLRRPFTISAAPNAESALQITVKPNPDGVVSKHLCSDVKPGGVLNVMPPFGGFALEPQSDHQRTLYFFAGGSGITPAMAMIEAALEHEQRSMLYLLYANRTADDIIFRAQIEKMLEEYPSQLLVKHILSKPSMWSMFSPWKSGRITSEVIQEYLAECKPAAQDAQYFICGPGSMNSDVRAALQNNDVPSDRIHAESFGGNEFEPTIIKSVRARLQLDYYGEAIELEVEEGQSIIAAVREAGLEPPYSCQSGICGACRAQLKSGNVQMQARMALEDVEIAKGAILTCQSYATTSELTVSFR